VTNKTECDYMLNEREMTIARELAKEMSQL